MQNYYAELYVHAGAMSLFSGFENGVGQIWFDGVLCAGTEASLFDCSLENPIGRHSCFHSEDAGVACIGRFTLFV